MLAMVAVGAMSFAAYSLIGLPSATALAVIAGVLNFVPMLGPFLAGQGGAWQDEEGAVTLATEHAAVLDTVATERAAGGGAEG